MNALPKAQNTLGFDPDALHRKYLAERDKRMGPGVVREYDPANLKYGEFVKDPFSPRIERAAIEEELDMLMLGGGLSGLTTCYFLQKAGVSNFRIIDSAGDFGGTWYWNRYPGVRCDIESYIYMPLLEEVGTIPSEKYATGREILEHCRAIGRKFGLYEKALFQTMVKEVRWNEGTQRWHVTTDRGDLLKARHVAVANAPLHFAKVPHVPGIDSFKGHTFHSGRWDYDYTGGAEDGRLTGLRDKRVAVIGTGPTAIQVIPEVAKYAKHLYVVQRTPPVVDARNNTQTDLEWFRSQPPGWHQRRKDNFMRIMIGLPEDENLVHDCWTDLAEILAAWLAVGGAPIAGASPEALQQLADYAKMERVRARIATIVKDPELAEKLKPWYNIFCKRPTFSDEYYQVYNQPNVTLIDTEGKGLERLDEHALYAGGQRIEVDCIIFSTGFDINADADQIGGYSLIGRGGLTLRDRWKDGMRTVHGTKISGFPNFYIVGALRQAAMGWNFAHTMTRQAQHAAAVVKWSIDNNEPVIEMSREDEDAWLAELARTAMDRQQFYSECTPGYLNNDGDLASKPPIFSTVYGGGPYKYDELLTEFETQGLARKWKTRKK